MDDWRKAQIASHSRDRLDEVIANSHRFMDQTEANRAKVVLAAKDEADAYRAAHGEDCDTAIDAWHAGWRAGYRDQPTTDCPHFCAGWFDGCTERLYRQPPIMPERPEGYYHMALEA